MRLVAGSNPAARTINKQSKGDILGYHDRKQPDYIKTGMGVVNPLIQIERKLKKIQDVLDQLPEKAMSVVELQEQIQKIIDGEE